MGEAVCVVCLLCVKLESKRRLVFVHKPNIHIHEYHDLYESLCSE